MKNKSKITQFKMPSIKNKATIKLVFPVSNDIKRYKTFLIYQKDGDSYNLLGIGRRDQNLDINHIEITWLKNNLLNF